MTQDFEAHFRARISVYLEELDGLVRRSVLETVESALGARANGVSVQRRVVSDGAVASVTAGGRSAAQQRAVSGRQRRKQQTDVLARDAEAIAGPLVALLEANGGLRLEEITSRTRMPAARLEPLIERLIADGRLRRDEHRHGARYVATGVG